MSIRKILIGAMLSVAVAAPAAASLHAARVPKTPHAYHARTAIHDPVDAALGIDIRNASLSQTGREVTLSVTTWRRLPPLAGSTTLCAVFTSARRQLCFGSSRQKLLDAHIDGAGKPSRRTSVPATVTFEPRRATARLDLATSGLRPGSVKWQMRATTHSAVCAAAADCVDLAPDTQTASTRLSAVRLVGCRVPNRTLYRHGPRSRKTVALTFDDGPSTYSRSVLAILRRENIHATFFLIGKHVGPRAADARQELADGNVVGNHSWSHANLAGGGARAAGEIAATQRAIAAATGFVPCLFRPPGGATSSSLVSTARSHGVATINWDVDPRDWSRPGSGSIYSSIVHATRSGSIVLMHDGGGPRSQTVAALPRVIHALRKRGYSFVTVPELLGGSLIYGR